MIFGQEMFWGGEPTREGWAGEFVQDEQLVGFLFLLFHECPIYSMNVVENF